MPSTSKKQHNFMAAVAHSPAFAKKVGVPQSVGQDFNEADKGKKFKQGGDMATKLDPRMMKMMAARDSKSRAPMSPGMKKGGMSKMAGGGLSSGHKSADGIITKGKTKAKDIVMKKGGKC
jgi:hypothetical protein